MADYDIFREQLAIKYPSYGHALWEPSPRNPKRPVQVGDVGFIRRGKFHRLFNALLPADDPSHELGVPEHYETLVPTIMGHLDTGSLSRNHYCSAGVSRSRDPGYHSRPGDFEEVLFQYERTRGAAVLSLPVAARREDTLAQGDFKRWIVKHIDSWFTFARKLGLDIQQMEEIILVTGCDRSKSWANVAFLGNEIDAQVSFGLNVEGPSPSINFQFSSANAQGAVLHHGPEGTNLPENQCVFIRGFRAARSFWILPKRLKAAAGPSPDQGGYDCDPESEVISVPAVTKYRDPLHILLDYIAEQASDCDMVLTHDDDLVMIGELGHGTSLETLEPDTMMDLLRKSNIEIQKVSCDSSPTDTGPNRDTSVVKVAMLSVTSENWNIGHQSQRSTLVAQNTDLGNTSLSRRSSLPTAPGSLQLPVIRGDPSKRESSLLDHGNDAPSTPQDVADSTFRVHTAKDILLAICEIGIFVWASYSKLIHEKQDRLLPAVIITFAASLLGWVFPSTRVVILRLFFTFFASFPLSVWFERESAYRRQLNKKFEALQHRVTSLQFDTIVPTDVQNSLPIIAKDTPADRDKLEQSMHDIIQPAIPEGDTDAFRNEYRQTLSVFLDHTFSSSSVNESVRSGRLVICLNAAHVVLGFVGVSQILQDILNGRWPELLQSAEIGHSLRRWSSIYDKQFTPDLQRIVAQIVVGVRGRDDHWISLVKAEYGIEEHVFRDYIDLGDSVLLSTLIHVTRQAFRTGTWTPWILSSLSEFDIRNTSPELQNDFCELWNDIVREAWKKEDSILNIPVQILREVRHAYIALHQGTDAALAEFSPSTKYFDPVLAMPRSYRFCNIPSHRRSYTPVTDSLAISSLIQLDQLPAASPRHVESDHISDSSSLL